MTICVVLILHCIAEAILDLACEKIDLCSTHLCSAGRTQLFLHYASQATGRDIEVITDTGRRCDPIAFSSKATLHRDTVNRISLTCGPFPPDAVGWLRRLRFQPQHGAIAVAWYMDRISLPNVSQHKSGWNARDHRSTAALIRPTRTRKRSGDIWNINVPGSGAFNVGVEVSRSSSQMNFDIETTLQTNRERTVTRHIDVRRGEFCLAVV